MTKDSRTQGNSGSNVFTMVLSHEDNEIKAVKDLADPIEITLLLTNSPDRDKEEFACSFWDDSASKWSTEGVSTVVEDDVVVCKTAHLTSFAAMIAPITDSTSMQWLIWLLVVGFIVAPIVGFKLFRRKSNDSKVKPMELKAKAVVPANV
ncbi:hypothetical protein P9112_007953 [Eukaryota sp. TZLM1-RC]